jgi:hypothetical protein
VFSSQRLAIAFRCGPDDVQPGLYEATPQVAVHWLVSPKAVDMEIPAMKVDDTEEI